jgi:hypothetical protein
MLDALASLDQAVGRDTPEANLERVIEGVHEFQQRVAPMFGGLFAEPQLLKAYQRSLRSQNRGPHRAVARIAAYIDAEQHLGRVQRRVDPLIAGTILMSSCFWRAFTEQFLGTPLAPPWPAFSKGLAAAVLHSEPAATRA